MKEKILKATHQGELKIGDNIKIPCAVLQNGTRVLSERNVAITLGSRGSGSYWQKKKESKKGAILPEYIAVKYLEPYIDDEIREKLLNPITYKPKTGRYARGIDATLLPEICDIWLKAREKGAIPKSQKYKADNAEMLVRGFAKVGIIALVDEATGYQEKREKDELHRLLALYLSEEKLKWAKTFPDEFYKQIYKLKGWQYPSGNKGNRSKRTPLIGKITNEIIYEKLPPTVIDKLRKKNPTNPKTKRRKWKHFQFLSENLGQPDLRDHLLQVIAIMRASSNWRVFKSLFARAFKKSRQLELLEEEGYSVEEIK